MGFNCLVCGERDIWANESSRPRICKECAGEKTPPLSSCDGFVTVLPSVHNKERDPEDLMGKVTVTGVVQQGREEGIEHGPLYYSLGGGHPFTCYEVQTHK